MREEKITIFEKLKNMHQKYHHCLSVRPFYQLRWSRSFRWGVSMFIWVRNALRLSGGGKWEISRAVNSACALMN